MTLPGAGAVFLMLLDSGPDVVGLQGPDQLVDVGLLGPPFVHLQDTAQSAAVGLRDQLVVDAAGLQGHHQTVAVGLPDPPAAVAVGLRPAVQPFLVEL